MHALARSREVLPPWRVAVTRDEPGDGPLSAGLRQQGFVPCACPVVTEMPPSTPQALSDAAARLEEFDWVVVASARAVRALASARPGPWPRGVRTAAVGTSTAALLREHGAHPPPVVAGEAGADALWQRLATLDTWDGRQVLVPTTPGGRRALIDALRGAGAQVVEVEAYRMVPASPASIASAWRESSPDAVVLASPSAARALVEALGTGALAGLRAVIAIGPSTSAALASFGLHPSTPRGSTFDDVARHLAMLRDTAVPPGSPCRR